MREIVETVRSQLKCHLGGTSKEATAFQNILDREADLTAKCEAYKNMKIGILADENLQASNNLLHAELDKVKKALEFERVQVKAYHSELDVVKKENEHLKANHKDMVERNAVLRQRPDLDINRLPTVKQLQARIKELEEEREQSQKWKSCVCAKYAQRISHLEEEIVQKDLTLAKFYTDKEYIKLKRRFEELEEKNK